MTSLQRPVPTACPIPRLAVIDDGEFDRMHYARIIRRTGLVGETLCFRSAEDALAYFEGPNALPVDVILLDINMPGMSGFDFLDRITARCLQPYANVVVLMLTTSLDPQQMARAAQYGPVWGCIDKPLEDEHLRRISALLASARAGPSPAG